MVLGLRYRSQLGRNADRPVCRPLRPPTDPRRREHLALTADPLDAPTTAPGAILIHLSDGEVSCQMIVFLWRSTQLFGGLALVVITGRLHQKVGALEALGSSVPLWFDVLPTITQFAALYLFLLGFRGQLRDVPVPEGSK